MPPQTYKQADPTQADPVVRLDNTLDNIMMRLYRWMLYRWMTCIALYCIVLYCTVLMDDMMM